MCVIYSIFKNIWYKKGSTA